MATVAVRFVFPAVSAEGAAFWIIRTAPISLRDFLWSKFWTGLVPVLVLTETADDRREPVPRRRSVPEAIAALAIVFMSFALVGLATGLGARYPRFGADASQVAGSYGGVAFMMQAVLFIIVMIALLGWPSSVYLFQRARGARVHAGSAVSDGRLLCRRRGHEPDHLVVVDAGRREGARERCGGKRLSRHTAMRGEHDGRRGRRLPSASTTARRTPSGDRPSGADRCRRRAAWTRGKCTAPRAPSRRP